MSTTTSRRKPAPIARLQLSGLRRASRSHAPRAISAMIPSRNTNWSAAPTATFQSYAEFGSGVPSDRRPAQFTAVSTPTNTSHAISFLRYGYPGAAWMRGSASTPPSSTAPTA